MFRTVTRALAVVALVLSTVGIRIWGSAVPVAGTSTVLLDPRPASSTTLQHPAIGTNPTVLEARRAISIPLSLRTADM